MSVRYAIRCGICRTAEPLTGQMLDALSAQVVDFMAAHDHVNAEFSVVPVPSAVPASATTAVETAAEPVRLDVA